MAIYPIIIPAPQAQYDAQQSVELASRTARATEALQSINLSAEEVHHAPRPLAVTLNIPLDDSYSTLPNGATPMDDTHNHGTRQVHTTYRCSEPMRRDSLTRRDALLKGKEGSRQRRRWENGRSLSMDDLSGARY